MRTLAGISPYWTEAERIRDGYELMNASVGASYSQGTWLTLSLKGGYSHTIDELFQVAHDSLIISSMLKQEGCDVFYARLDADMQFADRALRVLGAAYRPHFEMPKDFEAETDNMYHKSMQLARHRGVFASVTDLAASFALAFVLWKGSDCRNGNSCRILGCIWTSWSLLSGVLFRESAAGLT